MTLDFDLTGDLADVADGLETVTLLRRGATPGSPGTVVTGALRRSAATAEPVVGNRQEVRRQANTGGNVLAGDAVWHLPAEQLGEPPGLGDLIVDGSAARWTILEVQPATLASRWRVSARNLVVAHGLDDTIKVLQASYAKGTSGAAEPVWHVWRTGIRARIQEQDARVATEHRARRAARRYRIFLEEELKLDNTHRVQGPDGTIYRVLGTVGPERLGEPLTIEAESTP